MMTSASAQGYSLKAGAMQGRPNVPGNSVHGSNPRHWRIRVGGKIFQVIPQGLLQRWALVTPVLRHALYTLPSLPLPSALPHHNSWMIFQINCVCPKQTETFEKRLEGGKGASHADIWGQLSGQKKQRGQRSWSGSPLREFQGPKGSQCEWDKVSEVEISHARDLYLGHHKEIVHWEAIGNF